MDGKEYLQQISSTVRPEKKSKLSGFLGSPFFKVFLFGGIALIVVFVIGAVLNSGGSVSDKVMRLRLHVDNTLTVIETYQGSVKSSNLRSSSASLASILSNTSRELSDYYGEKKASQALSEEARLARDALSASLLTARSNGVLDSVYANKMAYEIFTLESQETEIYNQTSDEKLRTILSSSYASLSNLYKSFNEFDGK